MVKTRLLTIQIPEIILSGFQMFLVFECPNFRYLLYLFKVKPKIAIAMLFACFCVN
jgi:hypothetical protein